jgi:hypothetical protein
VKVLFPWRRLALALMVTVAPAVQAAIVQGSGQISLAQSYADHSGGTFVFKVANQPAGCTGFWVTPSQPGFKTVVAYILQAKAAGEAVRVHADNAQLWIGTP